MAETKNNIDSEGEKVRELKDFEKEQKLKNLMELRKEMVDKYGDDFKAAVDKFKEKIEIDHPDIFKDCELYYVLIGEDSEQECSMFDFKGDCSIEAFLEEWASRKTETEPEVEDAA